MCHQRQLIKTVGKPQVTAVNKTKMSVKIQKLLQTLKKYESNKK